MHFPIEVTWTGERTTAQAVVELEAARIPCGEVLEPAQTLVNEQVTAMGFIEEVSYPGVPGYPLTRFPVDLSKTPGTVRLRPPTLGEHTRSILVELGYSSTDIDRLEQERAV